MVRARAGWGKLVKLAALPTACLWLPVEAHADAPTDPAVAIEAPIAAAGDEPDVEDRAAIEAEVRDLRRRLQALEARLGVSSSAEASPLPVVTPQSQEVAAGQPRLGQPASAAQSDPGVGGFIRRQERAGTYDPEKGWILVDDEHAQLNLGVMTYARYLSQGGLDDSYVDSLGRVLPIDVRNEVQLNKVSLNFKGWLFDPSFQYLVFAWTNNANQGEGAQVVLAGFLRYRFADWLSLSAGLMPLPTTRSTNYSFPKWLRHDNRLMADEFYRGSYTSGVDASGQIVRGLQYRVMVGNNLSTLGVSSRELDDKLDTVSGALWWMPTTGEFGPGNEFGDYAYHREVATYLGLHFTQSTETAQGQPTEDDFENSQIRLSDGTLLFSPDPFGTGGKIETARWRMATLDAGVKYRGLSLEAQYYWREVDDFTTVGYVPVTKVEDQGFGVQASAMPMKDFLQTYVTYSKIWGENGDPSEIAFGANIYPFRRRELHVNLEAIKLDRSPVGGYHMPIPVGGSGWVFLTDFILAF